MFLFNKDTDNDVVVIAEIGVNHMGSLEWILKMLPQVKESGADAIKFQLFTILRLSKKPEYVLKKNLFFQTKYLNL